MANPYHHSLSSVKKFGGVAEDYQPIHDWYSQIRSTEWMKLCSKGFVSASCQLRQLQNSRKESKNDII